MRAPRATSVLLTTLVTLVALVGPTTTADASGPRAGASPEKVAEAFFRAVKNNNRAAAVRLSVDSGPWSYSKGSLYGGDVRYRVRNCARSAYESPLPANQRFCEPWYRTSEGHIEQFGEVYMRKVRGRWKVESVTIWN